jgi:hypothetical protein
MRKFIKGVVLVTVYKIRVRIVTRHNLPGVRFELGRELSRELKALAGVK